MSFQRGCQSLDTALIIPAHVCEMLSAATDSKCDRVTDSTRSQLFARPIEQINARSPLDPARFSILDDDSVLSMTWSDGGALLATISTSGQVKVWQVSANAGREQWPLLRVLRDDGEMHIEEFFTGVFLEGDGAALFVAAGKRKDRHCWDDDDNDNRILPGQLKIFDLVSGTCINRLEDGHGEEVLFLRTVITRHANFILSCGQDGRICRWQFDRSWRHLQAMRHVSAGDMVFHVDVTSDGRFLLVAVDDCIQLYDFDTMKMLKEFVTGFTSYCDFVKVVSTQEDGTVELIVRGVELLSTDTLLPSAPNSIILASLDLNRLELRIIRRLQDERYNANSWLLKPGLSPNGRYLAAPTITGHVLIFSLDSGRCTAVLHQHDDSEVRQTLFHPSLPILATCGDDGRVKIYHQCPCE